MTKQWTNNTFLWIFMDVMLVEGCVRTANITQRALTATSANPLSIGLIINNGMKPTCADVSLVFRETAAIL